MANSDRRGLDPTPDDNRDPITGTPGSHPAGVAGGAFAGGAAGGVAGDAEPLDPLFVADFHPAHRLDVGLELGAQALGAGRLQRPLVAGDGVLGPLVVELFVGELGLGGGR